MDSYEHKQLEGANLNHTCGLTLALATHMLSVHRRAGTECLCHFFGLGVNARYVYVRVRHVPNALSTVMVSVSVHKVPGPLSYTAPTSGYVKSTYLHG